MITDIRRVVVGGGETSARFGSVCLALWATTVRAFLRCCGTGCPHGLLPLIEHAHWNDHVLQLRDLLLQIFVFRCHHIMILMKLRLCSTLSLFKQVLVLLLHHAALVVFLRGCGEAILGFRSATTALFHCSERIIAFLLFLTELTCAIVFRWDTLLDSESSSSLTVSYQHIQVNWGRFLGQGYGNRKNSRRSVAIYWHICKMSISSCVSPQYPQLIFLLHLQFIH